jgi:TPR repeat protein
MVEAVKWFGLAARQDQLDAELELGNIYLGGRGLPEDFRAARKWFRRAAAQHSARAINALGYIAEQGGFGVAKDVQQARKYYLQAAVAGDVKALMNLGRVYLEGIGVERDYIEAYKWFYLASKTGGGAGRHYLAELDGTVNYGDFAGKPLTGEQIKAAVQRAEAFQELHSKPVN